MLTGIVCVIAGMFIDHFYPVPASFVRGKVIEAINAARKALKKGKAE